MVVDDDDDFVEGITTYALDEYTKMDETAAMKVDLLKYIFFRVCNEMEICML